MQKIYKFLITNFMLGKTFLCLFPLNIFLFNENLSKILQKEAMMEPQYKEKLKSFNPRFINLEKNKKTIRDAVMWAFIPCGGFIFLKEYKTLALFSTFFVGIGAWFIFNLYHYKNPYRAGTNMSYNFVRYMYMSGGLFIIGYIISIIVSAILAKMKIFDDTKNLEIIVRPSELGKSQNVGVNFNLNFKNL